MWNRCIIIFYIIIYEYVVNCIVGSISISIIYIVYITKILKKRNYFIEFPDFRLDNCT